MATLPTEAGLLIEIKDFIKEDSTDKNVETLILSLKGAAEEYIKSSGVNKDAVDYNNKLYKLAVMMLVGHWYDNRGIVVVGTITKEMEISFNSIIVQLRTIKPPVTPILTGTEVVY